LPRSYQVAASAVCFIASPPTLYVGLDSGALWSYSVSNNYADFSPTSQPTPLHTARIVKFAHATKQRLLLSISKDKHLAVVDLDSNKVRHSVAVGHPGMNAAQAGLASLVYDDEEEKVFVGTAANFIYIYTLPPDSPPLLLHALHGHTAPVTALHYHAADHSLFSGSYDHHVGVWTIQPGKSAVEASRSHLNGMMSLGPSKQIKAVIYCPALREVVTGVEGGWLCVWNVDNGRIRYAWKGHGENVSGLWWKDGEKVLVSSGQDGKVKYWDMSKTQLTPSTDPKPTASQTTADDEQQQTEASGQTHSSVVQSEPHSIDRQSSSDPSSVLTSTLIDHLAFTSTTATIQPLPADADTDSTSAPPVTDAVAQAVDESEPVDAQTINTAAAHSSSEEAEGVADEPSMF